MALNALGVPALVALALGGPGRARGGMALILAFAAANFALLGWPHWPPMGAMSRLPLLAPLALALLSRRPAIGALTLLALGGLTMQLTLQNGDGLRAAAALTALGLAGAGLARADNAPRLQPLIVLLASGLLAASGSVVLGQSALALAVACAALRLRGGEAEAPAAALAVLLLSMGVLLAELSSPAAALMASALLLRSRAPLSLGLALGAITLHAAFELLIPPIATAG